MARPSNAVSDPEQRGKSEHLVVLLHAFRQDASSLVHVRRLVANAYPDADILAPDLPAGMWPVVTPDDLLVPVLQQIDKAWNASTGRSTGPYREILLIGHSLGALLARKAYVCACGESEKAPIEERLKEALQRNGVTGVQAPREWATRVSRIVLLAAMNRGWHISHHLSIPNIVLWSLGSALGTIQSLWKPPLMFWVRRGAPFITQLRIQWLAMRRRAAKPGVPGNATTVQLLGSIDDFVSPEDNIDLVAGRDFIYLDVPQSGHSSIIEMDDTPAGKGRADVFNRAATASLADLATDQVVPADLTLIERPEVTDLVFVIHGIRDKGYWTHKIARRVIAEGRKHNKMIASETSSYGYFPMLPFIMPGTRRKKVEWLMDQYAEALAIYPNADFSYVGHSNGTYMLARALEEYPSCRFKHVVFAGSVVRRKYPWLKFVPRQVRAVLNYRATSDWVVAFFPKGLEQIHWQDLGGAGHDGFHEAARGGVLQHGQYVIGSHDAAIREPVWDSIAQFVITGKLPTIDEALLSDKRNVLVSYPSIVAPVLWVIGAVLLATGGYLIWHLPLAEWLMTTILIAYIAAIWKVLTRV